MSELLEDSNADLSVLTETWLMDDDDIWVQGLQLKNDEYHRKGRKGGGLPLMTK